MPVCFFMGKAGVTGWTVVFETLSGHLIMCIRLRPLNTVHRLARVFAVLVAAGVSVNARADSVLVFTDHLHPVSAAGSATVIELDAPRQIESALAAQLPANSGQAAAVVTQRLHDGGKALEQQFVHAYQGVVDAWQLGVNQLPAVVVDRRWVVYGDPDVAHALARIAAWRDTRP